MLARRGRDDRAVTSLLGYILAVGVFLAFTMATLGAAFTVFDGAMENAQQNQMEHDSQVLAHSIETVDRLARSSSANERISRTVDLSSTLSGEGYKITIVNSGGDSHIVFETDTGSISERVPYGSTTDVAETTIQGGPVEVVREAGGTQIKIVPHSNG